MTNYEHAGEMQELCFKASQAFRVLEDKGLHDFYLAASNGYEEMRNSYSVEEAENPVDEEQLKTLESVAAYVKEVQQQAAEKLGQEATA